MIETDGSHSCQTFYTRIRDSPTDTQKTSKTILNDTNKRPNEKSTFNFQQNSNRRKNTENKTSDTLFTIYGQECEHRAFPRCVSL